MVIVDILKNFGWLDFLDITLVAFLIYQIILLLKGTKMVRLLAGLCLLLTVNIITQLVRTCNIKPYFRQFPWFSHSYYRCDLPA